MTCTPEKSAAKLAKQSCRWVRNYIYFVTELGCANYLGGISAYELPAPIGATAPSLTMALAGKNLELTWPASASDYVLEQRHGERSVDGHRRTGRDERCCSHDQRHRLLPVAALSPPACRLPSLRGGVHTLLIFRCMFSGLGLIRPFENGR
ncbi:MAG: hypothetical protein L0Z50_00250 [Verrucomicrobiales bacterium]|nr:hypothetical protein [Verrucomicrobiales bacterium]